jgi:hypothetical protein
MTEFEAQARDLAQKIWEDATDFFCAAGTCEHEEITHALEKQRVELHIAAKLAEVDAAAYERGCRAGTELVKEMPIELAQIETYVRAKGFHAAADALRNLRHRIVDARPFAAQGETNDG